VSESQVSFNVAVTTTGKIIPFKNSWSVLNQYFTIFLM
jgi:hypothetical protein